MKDRKTLAERILERLSAASLPQDDDQLADHLVVIRQHVNQVCRRLEGQGRIRRFVGPEGKIVNELLSRPVNQFSAPDVDPSVGPGGMAPLTRIEAALSEDEVKAAVKAHLEGTGYEVRVRWGRERGIDVEATRGSSRWIIEVKGEVASQQQQTNYFLGALGELIQRMSDPDASYALALPDNRTNRGLVTRLPDLARRRLNLTVLFVARAPGGLRVDVVGTPDKS